MGGRSIGEIALDLKVNRGGFRRQMSDVTNTAKRSCSDIAGAFRKIGSVVAGAFAVKKLVDFGKQCIELGSDLAEVQNVVDVTFPAMTAQVDEFARSAAASFGLSETMAKKFTGTFGSMAKAFGFSEKQAYDMGTALTGLAGDVASFYNLSQDEAYTKLKSIFTGETESLKDLGVVMTQTALDSYAMANGFGKTTSAMTEAEKVALRYQFVQAQLSAAQGDFARTSDSWANQVRILSLQAQSTMATIGQGLINLFTPVLKILNVVLGKIATLASAFKAFTEMITGNQGSGSASISEMGDSAGAAAGGFDSASAAASGLSDSAAGAGKAAKKAAKEMRALMGFDQVNKLSAPEDSSGGSGSGSSGGGASLGAAVDFGSISKGEPVIGRMDGLLSGLIERCKELGGLFKQGFVIGFGDSEKKIGSIIESVKGIGASIKGIVTDQEVLGSFNGFLDAVAEGWGKKAGAMASIGLTIADNLLGGISQYLDQSSEYIKEKLCSIFDISADVERLQGDLYAAVADILDVFSGDTAKQCTADLVGIFADSFLEITELGEKFSRDILSLVVTPLKDNVDKIKVFFEDLLSPISDVLSTLHTALRDTFSSIGQMYDEHIKPMVDSFASGISDVVGTLLDGFHTHIAPVLDALAERFDQVWKDYVQPAIESAIGFIGTLADAVRSIWEETLQPFLEWVAGAIFPVVAPIIEAVGTIFIDTFGLISRAVGNMMDIFSGLVEFLAGVFTGDWQKAWNGIKNFFSAIWTGIRDFLKTIWESIKTVFAPVADWFRGKFDAAVSGIKNVFSSVDNFFSGIWTGIKNTFGNVAGWFKDKFSAAWKAVKNVFSAGGKIFDGIKDGILSGLKAVVNAIIGGINKVIAIPFNGINSALNGIRKVEILGWEPFSWIPTISVPQIPKLAQGGYVKANTPQLAMIGDNRHQGEVVAPEDKLLEMAKAAAGMVGGGNSEVIRLLKQLIDLIKSLNGDTVLYVGNEELARANQKGLAKLQRRYSSVEFQ
ncbi:MAG: hypothetical protein HFI66_00880 [Lachnospiraceae bacterium]|jgi:phage-related protein|nr:hypothetical protein [Lachnospiraceae bacterium]